jgi:hypothetical protein
LQPARKQSSVYEEDDEPSTAAFSRFANLLGQILTVSSIDQTITTDSGFTYERKCLLLQEASIYDDQMRKVRIWVIDRPLCGDYLGILKVLRSSEAGF